MPANKKHSDKGQVGKNNRKRVNRLKSVIIACVAVLLLTSIFLNIVLAFKVLHLENQIEQLYSNVPVASSQVI